MWFETCKKGFSAAGQICKPECPEKMIDIGISCNKHTYWRDGASGLQCKEGMEEQLGYCYEPCPKGTNGVGPVCWGNCPKGTTQCGSLCLGPDDSCDKYILNNVKNWLELVTKAVMLDVAGTVAATASVGLSYTYPICRDFNDPGDADPPLSKVPTLSAIYDEVADLVDIKSQVA